MTPLAKNILTILGIITVGYASYYLYLQQAVVTDETQGDVVYENMLSKTRVFIERSQELNGMKFDTEVLSDSRFQSLKAFTQPVEDQPYGRDNPFAPAESSTFINTYSE
jgi:hypothetical protein